MDMDSLLRTITKNFLLNESYSPNVKTYIQSLTDLIEQIRPSSKKDMHRLRLAKENLSQVRRHFRKLEEHVQNLEEQLKVLEENRGSK